MDLTGKYMTQTIYGLAADRGDGSAGIHWFRDKALVDRILDDELDLETYGINEGCPSETLTFPADLDLEKCGFMFCTKDDFEDME